MKKNEDQLPTCSNCGGTVIGDSISMPSTKQVFHKDAEGCASASKDERPKFRMHGTRGKGSSL
jgi:hypothetical protein